MRGITFVRQATRGSAWGLVLVLAAAAGFAVPGHAMAAPLGCSGTATNVVGAHAGSLSIRVGISLQCDESAHFEVVLPGGTAHSFDTDASGAFTGIAGDAYVCSGHPQPVAILATSSGGTWSGLLTIEPEAGAPPDPDGPGPVCDAMLHPGFTAVTYTGPLAAPGEAFATDRFTAVLPFGSSSSLDGAEHVFAVFESVPGATPAESTWAQWRPLAPAFVNQLHLLVPGHTYLVFTDAELAWTFPPAAQ